MLYLWSETCFCDHTCSYSSNPIKRHVILWVHFSVVYSSTTCSLLSWHFGYCCRLKTTHISASFFSPLILQTLPRALIRDFHSFLSGEMPVVAPLSGDTSSSGSIVPFLPEVSNHSVVYPLRHGLKPPIARLSISWSGGNTLRVSVLRKSSDDGEAGGKVVEVRLGNGDAEISDAQWRRIAYGSVTPFALLQNRRSSISSLSKMSISPPHYHVDW